MSLLLLLRPRAGAAAPLIGCDLAQENGDKLLQEDGGTIVLDGYTCDVTPPAPPVGGKFPRYQTLAFELTEQEDDELMAWIQTHRPDPLGRR